MATVNAADYSIAVNGDIRYTGTTTNNTVIELHRWFGTLMDDAQASGNDILDITDATASDRSTDNIINLNAPYNIDAVLAEHLFDGSIIQKNGDEIYDGILVFAPAGTPLQLIQNGTPVSPNFWDTGLNALSSAGISHRFLVKTRTAGADIDGRRLLGQTRSVGNSYSEFPINGTARGNNVIALAFAADLNNGTAASTIAGWTDVVNVTQGYKLLDVDNNVTTEPYYSEWNRASRTMNQFYERHKWLARESTIEDSSTSTATPFQVGNATVIGQAQSWSNGANAQVVTRVRVQMRKVLLPTGAITCKIYAHAGALGTTSIPTGAALGTSVAIEAADLTLAYREYEFEFTTPVAVAASTNFTVAFEHAAINGTNYIEIDGAAAGAHAGNRAQLIATTWTATAANDLGFEVYACPQISGLAGELFRGPTHEIVVNTPVGTINDPELMTWTEATVVSSGQLLAADSPTAATKIWIQLLTGIAPTNTTVLTGAGGGTVAVNVTVTPRTVSAPPVGNTTGTNIIGAYGLGIETGDLVAADKVLDLDDVQRIPPNNVTFTVGGLVVGEDRILVAPLGFEFAYDTEVSGPFTLGELLTFTSPAGTANLAALTDNGTTGRMQISAMASGATPTDNSAISGGTSSATASVNGTVKASENPRLLKLLTTLSSGTETAVVCTAAIPTDTPAAGDIRVELNSGIVRELPYLSYTSATFTIASTSFVADNALGGAGEAGNGVYPAYIDKLATATSESFTGVYTGADRSLFIRVRDGAGTPIKTFETTGTLGSAGGSSTAIRTPDA